METPSASKKSAGGDSKVLKEPSRSIFALQLASLMWIWIFVIAVALWILNLLRRSIELQDAPGATVAISLIAIPVFLTLASILTYVFVGLQKEDRRLRRASGED